MVGLSPAVDVPVTVNIVWTAPVGVTLSPAIFMKENLTRYTSTVAISSFGRNQSGSYTCTAVINSQLLFNISQETSDELTLITGKEYLHIINTCILNSYSCMFILL